jgi:hypothetical protein
MKKIRNIALGLCAAAVKSVIAQQIALAHGQARQARASPQRKPVAAVYAALFSTTLAIAPTLAWSYDINFGPLGHGWDICGGGVIASLPVIGHALSEVQAQAAGAALEQWIIASHNSALNGAMPIPYEIRQKLTGYVSEDSINRVRYKIGDNSFAYLAHAIEQGGFAAAVTLIDVVVFRGPTEANNPSIWAHELTHVDQYRDWGVHRFAIQYARDYKRVENPAYAKGNGYWAWAQQQRGITQVSPPQPPMGNICSTQPERSNPGPWAPLRSRCFINFPSGPVYGQVFQ